MTMAWPGNLTPVGLEWRIVKAGLQASSPFTRSLQAIDFLGEHWEVNIALRGEGMALRRSRLLESMLMYLSGGVNKVEIFNWRNPIPAGTLRGSPTLQTVTVRGDTQLVVTCAAGSTLLGGDLIGAGTQVLMVAPQGCTAVSTTLTVPLVNRVRGVIAEDSAIVWDRPKLTVIMPEMSAGVVYRPGQTLPSEVQLLEAY